jgi:hypothetical protein
LRQGCQDRRERQQQVGHFNLHPLYLDGKIQQWFTRGDGKGVIFLLNCKDVAEARALVESLPLSEENLMDEQFIPVGPLLPLGILLRDNSANKVNPST